MVIQVTYTTTVPQVLQIYITGPEGNFNQFINLSSPIVTLPFGDAELRTLAEGLRDAAQVLSPYLRGKHE